MSDKEPKTKAYYEELSKCPKGGKHRLISNTEIMDTEKPWQCAKCGLRFTFREGYFMDRE